jgi:hypothetical protein
MNNNQIVLDALKSKLETVKNAKDLHYEEVYQPAINQKTAEVLEWFKINVSSLIPGLSINGSRIEIFKAESPESWGSLTISLDSDWHSEERSRYAKMNWYGSSATLKDENTLLDVQVFGAVANKLHFIQHEFINVWYPAMLEIENPLGNLNDEIYLIEQSIRETEANMKNDVIETYKKPGFECTLNPKLDIVRDWVDGKYTEYELKEVRHEIKLSFGRSNYDYVYVNSFKVQKINKYKAWIEVISNLDKPVVRTQIFEVSTKKFNDFIQDVYEWQNGGSERKASGMKILFEKYYATKTA